MSNLKRFSLAFVSISLCLGGPGMLLTQDIVQKPIRVEVNVATKLIQVSVTDRQGKPITDMTAADFEVTDNGKIVKIDHFEKHIYDNPSDWTPLPAEESGNLTRKFFLIFDFAFLDQGGMAKAKKAALHFLDTVPQPSDEIALISYSPVRSLSLQEYLTKDIPKVREIIENYGVRSITGRAENLLDFYLMQRQVDLDAAQAPGKSDDILADPFLGRMAKSRLQTFLNEGQKSGYNVQVMQFAQALKNLAETLRYLPGSKNVLFFSNGISRTVLYGRKANKIEVQESAGSPEEWAALMSTNDANLSESSVRDSYTEMLDAFKASNCQVYSFNESRERGGTAIEDADGTGINLRDIAGDESLRQFSSVTGGRYYSNTMDYQRAIEDLKSATGAYYVLGYVLDDKRDGAYHKIKVKTPRKGAKLSFQPGYFNPKPFSEFTGFEKIVHLMDVALAETPQSGFLVPVLLTPVPVRAGGMGFFSAYSSLDAESFGDLLGKSTEAILFVFDKNGATVATKRFSLTDLPAGREGFLLDFSLPVKPGDYEGRLVLRNLKTGRAARGSATFQILEPAPTGAWIDPILLLEEGRNLYGLCPSPDFSLSRMYGYDGKTFLPRAGDIPKGIAKITAAVRCGGLGDSKDIEFVGAILPKTGDQARVSVPVTVQERIPSASTQLIRIEIALGDLPAGVYRLDIIAQSKSVGAGATTSTVITIK